MARLITSGGELRDHITSDINSPDGWSAGAVATTTETTNYRSGDSAFACAGAAGSTSFRAWSYTAPALASNLYARVYLRVSALPSAAAKVVAFVTSADAALVSVRLNADGTFALWNDAGAAQIGSNTGTVLQVDSWYRVQLRLNIGTGAIDQAEMRVALDVAQPVEEVVSGSTLTVSDTHSARLRAGWIDAPGVTSTMLLDDIAVNNTTGTAQISWPDGGNVVLFLPMSTTTTTPGWSNCAGSTTTSALIDFIDNRPPIGLADHSTAGHAGATAHQIRAATTSATINTFAGQSFTEKGIPGPIAFDVVAGTAAAGATLNFGDVAARQSRAQSFVVGTPLVGDRVGLDLWKIGSPTDDVIVELQTDSGNAPSGTVLATATIPNAKITTVAGSSSAKSTLTAWDTPPAITPGTVYWVVCRRTGALDATNYFAWDRIQAALNADIVNAVPAVYDGTSWAQSGTSWATQDHLFRITVLQPTSRVKVITPVVCHGQNVTGAKLGGVQLNNTGGTLTSFTFANNVGVSGTYPTNWYWAHDIGSVYNWQWNAIGPVLSVSKNSGTGTAPCMVCFAGIHVEYEVVFVGWLRWQKTADSTFWWGKRALADTLYERADGTVLAVDVGDWAMYPEPQITAGQDFPATTVAVADGGSGPTGYTAA